MVTLKSMSDEQLVKLFTDGNNRAFDTLLLRYKSFLYSHIYSITKDYNESNDILQEAYIRMINSLRQKFYIENGRFKYWALRIAHNIAIDSMRDSKNSDINGYLIFDNLPLGQYKLKETKNLSNYNPNNQEYIISIQENDIQKTLTLKKELKKTIVEVPSTGKNNNYTMEKMSTCLILIGVFLIYVKKVLVK